MYGKFKVLLYLNKQKNTDKTLHIFEFQAKFQKNTFKSFFESQTSLNFSKFRKHWVNEMFLEPPSFPLFRADQKTWQFLAYFYIFFSWLIFEAFLCSNQGFDFGTWRHFLEERQNKADLYRNGLALSRKNLCSQKIWKKNGKKILDRIGKFPVCQVPNT